MPFDIGRDADAPDRFFVHERWRDLAALQAHLTTAHFAVIGTALGGLLAGPPAVRVLTPVVPEAGPGAAADEGAMEPLGDGSPGPRRG